MIHHKVVKNKDNPEKYDIILTKRLFFIDKPLYLIEEGLSDSKTAEYFAKKLDNAFQLGNKYNK